MTVRERRWVNKDGSIGKSLLIDVGHGDQRVRVTARTRKRGTARDREAEIRTKLNAGTYPYEGRNRTIRELAERYIAYQFERVEDGTLVVETAEHREGLLRNYLLGQQDRLIGTRTEHMMARMVPFKQSLGDVKLSKARSPIISAHLNQLRRAGSSYTIAMKLLMTMGDMFRYAKTDLGWIDIVPTDDITIPKKLDERGGANLELPMIKAAQFLISLAGRLLQIKIKLACTTAMRPGEMNSRTWGDYDFERYTVRVRGTVARQGKQRKPKTPDAVRSIPVPRWVIEDLKRLRAELGNPPDEALVFPTTNGGTISTSHFARDEWRPLVAKARALHAADPTLPALPETFNWKIFRHFALSWFNELAASDDALKGIAGHRNSRTTRDHYVQLVNEKRDLVEGVARQLGAPSFDGGSQPDPATPT